MRLKASQLREMTDEELAQKRSALKKELFDLRYQAKMGRVDKPHRMREARKEIARIETILTERMAGTLLSTEEVQKSKRSVPVREKKK